MNFNELTENCVLWLCTQKLKRDVFHEWQDCSEYDQHHRKKLKCTKVQRPNQTSFNEKLLTNFTTFTIMRPLYITFFTTITKWNGCTNKVNVNFLQGTTGTLLTSNYLHQIRIYPLLIWTSTEKLRNQYIFELTRFWEQSYFCSLI